MICHAVLAIKQTTVQQIRALLAEGATLTANQQRAVEILKDFRHELQADGQAFRTVTKAGQTWFVFNQIVNAGDLAWLESQFPNLIEELYIGNEFGGPLGTSRTYDDLGNPVYSGTPLWLPSGGNADFSHLRAALHLTRTVYDANGTPVGTEPNPEWYFNLHPAGWVGLDKPWWEHFIGPLAAW